jgi:hypothetical protein
MFQNLLAGEDLRRNGEPGGLICSHPTKLRQPNTGSAAKSDQGNHRSVGSCGPQAVRSRFRQRKISPQAISWHAWPDLLERRGADPEVRPDAWHIKRATQRPQLSMDEPARLGFAGRCGRTVQVPAVMTRAKVNSGRVPCTCPRVTLHRPGCQGQPFR